MKLDKIFDNKLRQTGRTLKMVEKAKYLAKEGRAVYVITANDQEQRRIARLFGNENPYANVFGVKIETPLTSGNFSWKTCSLLGAHSNCVVLIDHFAIETEIMKRLQSMEKAIQSLESSPKDYRKLTNA